MHIPKRYGQSRIDNCPFCGKIAVIKNKQGVHVCHGHKDSKLENLKCVCGEWLDIKEGKWGPYFHCMTCGGISFKKGIDMNPNLNPRKRTIEKGDKTQESKKEITVTSDQLDFIY